MTYNGIGVSTPRGTGTNGYVQRAMGALQRPTKTFEERRARNYGDAAGFLTRRVDPALAEHERKRAVEVALTDWAEAEGIYDRQ